MTQMKEQLEKLRALGDCIEHNAPRNDDGALYEPFRSWLERCRKEERRAREWLGSSEQEPEPTQAAGKRRTKKRGGD